METLPMKEPVVLVKFLSEGHNRVGVMAPGVFKAYNYRVLYPSRTLQPFLDICLSETAINEIITETWSILSRPLT